MMPKKVRKAVFPAAGLGTRFLPATKAVPKEMLPLVDKPIIQYGVEEALAAGCDQIIVITGRGKSAIEDHFDISYELENELEERGKEELLKQVRQISGMINVAYVRQKKAGGLGHAVLMARELVGDEPFGVILPDDIIDAQSPVPEADDRRLHETGSRPYSRPRKLKGRPSPLTACSTRRRLARMTAVSTKWRTWSRSPSRRTRLRISPSSGATF